MKKIFNNKSVQIDKQGYFLSATRMIFIVVIVIFSSCKKFVEVANPINQVVSSEVFSNDATATASVVGLYSQMMQTNLYLVNGGVSVYPGLSADEIYNTSTNASLDPFTQNVIPSNSNIIQTNLWRYGYNYIYQANACIEGLNSSTGVSAPLKQQLIGEMKFARAFCYFYLVNLFGDVPLETTTNYQTNENLPRTPTVTVYKQIVADLTDAQNLLMAAYPTSGPVRPNLWAATALLARVYLYQQDWKDAETQATNIINSGQYSLVSNLNNVFLANSPEAIWQLMPVLGTFNTAEGATFIPSSTSVKPTYALNQYLLNAFETGDQRKGAWLKSNTVSGTPYYYPYKYKVGSSSSKTEYNTILRLAEQYLIRAEARAEQNNIAGAVSDVNVIRQRAVLSQLPTNLSQSACLSAIAQENRIEFFTECGHRWFDLKRTGQINTVLSAEKTGWSANAALYPLPSNDINLNPLLIQNPGY